MNDNDLISRAVLNDAIEKEYDGVCVYDVSGTEVIRDFQTIVDMQPAVEAVPVKHGQWKEVHTKARGYGKMWYQHNCSPLLYESPYYYCPFCGDKMDEKKKET